MSVIYHYHHTPYYYTQKVSQNCSKGWRYYTPNSSNDEWKKLTFNVCFSMENIFKKAMWFWNTKNVIPRCKPQMGFSFQWIMGRMSYLKQQKMRSEKDISCFSGVVAFESSYLCKSWNFTHDAYYLHKH